jgi:adenine-specific DNA-methyltransferase
MAANVQPVPLKPGPVRDLAASFSFTELRANLRAQAQAAAERLQVTLAEGIAVEAIRGYWSAMAKELPLREPPRDKRQMPEALTTAAYQLGRAVSSLPVADAAYQLSLLYTGLLRPEWRAKHGVFYTPPSLANRLLDQATAAGLDWSKAHILDPAAGAAAFLVPAAARLLPSMAGCSPAVALQNLCSRLRGFEIDPFSAWMGQVFIEAAILPLIEAANRRPSDFITVRDSLKVEGKASFDLVVGNPPFGRISLPEKQRERFGRSLYGHANLYGLFMDLAVDLAKPEGFVAFLTPSSFLAGEYFRNLRSLLWKEAPPVALDFVALRKGVFEDVLQETVLATYRKGAGRNCASVSFIQPQPDKGVVPEPAGGFTLPRKSSAPWILPRHADEEKLAKRLRSMPERLEDWGYKVSTGPLVWNRHKLQLHDRPGKGRIPLVWAESVSSDGRFEFRSERRNHKPYFRVEEGDDWLVVRRPCVLLQRTTAKEQARRLIAAEMPLAFVAAHDGITIENHLNMIIPVVDRPAVPPALLAAFLNSGPADRAFRCLSGSVAVSAYELENLPLPKAAELKGLLGRKLDRATVEGAVRQLYLEEDA